MGLRQHFCLVFSLFLHFCKNWLLRKNILVVLENDFSQKPETGLMTLPTFFFNVYVNNLKSLNVISILWVFEIVKYVFTSKTMSF